MVLYELALLLLAKDMREADPGVLQPWCADDASMRGTARRKKNLFHLMATSLPGSKGYDTQMVMNSSTYTADVSLDR